MKLSYLFLATFLVATSVYADDGAASIAAGGLIVMGRETRITMAKEVLQISSSKVIVDYDFRNDSDEDVTTEVAFPIPAYEMDEISSSLQGFDDFHLWINDEPADFKVEARAFLKNKEFTRLLKSMQIDIASFGRASEERESSEIERLSVSQHKLLEKSGLVGEKSNGPSWQVRKKYYWQQTFPAHKTIHIRHEYTPALGSTNSIKYGMEKSSDVYIAKEFKSFCIDDKLHAILQGISDNKLKDAPYSYVDFILTTANTWKTPIEDFTLIVERPHQKGSDVDYVSFCWDGSVTKIDADHFSAHTTNLIPKKELRVGFFDVSKSVF